MHRHIVQPPSLPRVKYPESLPIVSRKADIVAAIRRHPVVIITGETGSGKTTQIPKMCIEAGRGRRGVIGCTQPRRIAAVTVAQRIAEELGENIGRSVGYKIRFEDQSGLRPLIKVMTDGILLMEAQTDPHLRAYDTIIVDEAHERSLNIDFTLGILKQLLRVRRNFKVIITSATIDTDKFSQAFGEAPIIEVSGRTYPVEVRYRPPDPDAEEKGDFTHIDAAVQAVDEIFSQRRGGDILVFMPTEQDIRETCDLLTGRYKQDCTVLPMFARLSWPEQRRVFETVISRKIIVATNVAETSLTIPGIRFVIDTGLARISQYNPRTRTTSLHVRPISRSSADQRKGRCGRIEHGICVRLYTEENYEKRPLFTPPQIQRANLAEVILRMLSLKLGAVETFPFIDAPAPRAIRDGLEMLQELGAIEKIKPDDNMDATGSFRLTPMGQRMARLPIDPRIARMLLEAEKEKCVKEVLVLASALSIQDPRERPLEQAQEADRIHASFRDPTSDFMTMLRIWDHYNRQFVILKTQNAMRKFCRESFLSYRRMREWREVHDQLRSIMLEQQENRVSRKIEDAQNPTDGIHKSILSGYLANIAVRETKNIYTATKGRQVMIFPGSSVFNKGGNWIVAAEIVETSRLFSRTVANIDPEWLEALGGDLCRHAYSEPRWDKNRGEVVASEQVTLFGLVIVPARNVSYGRIDPDASSRIFVRSALVDGEIRQNLPFLIHNRKLIEKTATLEDKIRRRGFLADDEQIARFYETRLPGIYDVRTLQKLIRSRGGDGFLRMNEADILDSHPDDEELAQYPDEFAAGNLRFRLAYRFAPGDPDDGVTIRIPLHLLSKAPVETAENSIPGLYREKITALLRGLPKEYRKKLQPLADKASVIVSEMPPEKGSLPSMLGKFISRRFGVDIPAVAWETDNVPEHLKMRYLIVDASGQEVVAGRDLHAFKTEILLAQETAIFDRARNVWEKSGITEWNFGDLPDEIPLQSDGVLHGFAYPGLQAADGSVNLRLFHEQTEALHAHLQGIVTLYMIHFSQEMKYLKKSVALSGDIKIWAGVLGGVKSVEKKLMEKILRDLFAVNIRNAADFERHAQLTAPLILDYAQNKIREIKPFLQAYHESATTLNAFEVSHRLDKHSREFLQTIRGYFNTLVPEDFLLQYDAERLKHIIRYLKAAVLRAERGLLNPGKDMKKSLEIKYYEEYLNQSLELINTTTSVEKRHALAEFRWMLEEYKISLFAQEIKTPYPVSKKRLDEKQKELELLV